jgi:hypothetical protein
LEGSGRFDSLDGHQHGSHAFAQGDCGLQTRGDRVSTKRKGDPNEFTGT